MPTCFALHIESERCHHASSCTAPQSATASVARMCRSTQCTASSPSQSRLSGTASRSPQRPCPGPRHRPAAPPRAVPGSLTSWDLHTSTALLSSGHCTTHPARLPAHQGRLQAAREKAQQQQSQRSPKVAQPRARCRCIIAAQAACQWRWAWGRTSLGLEGLGDADAAVHKLRDLHKVLLYKAARGQRRGAHADAAGHHRALVAGHRVLVQRDVRELEHTLHPARPPHTVTPRRAPRTAAPRAALPAVVLAAVGQIAPDCPRPPGHGILTACHETGSRSMPRRMHTEYTACARSRVVAPASQPCGVPRVPSRRKKTCDPIGQVGRGSTPRDKPPRYVGVQQQSAACAGRNGRSTAAAPCMLQHHSRHTPCSYSSQTTGC